MFSSIASAICGLLRSTPSLRQAHKSNPEG